MSNNNHDLDDTDREILKLLSADARMPFADIADIVDVSPPTVADRVRKMEDSGVIDEMTIRLGRDVNTHEVSRQTLERLVKHAESNKDDPAVPWHTEDKSALTEARQALSEADNEL